jgi:hypothetical protein
MYREMQSTAGYFRTWAEGIAVAIERGATAAMDMHHCGRGRREWRVSVDHETEDIVTATLIELGVGNEHIWYSHNEWRLIDDNNTLYAYIFQHHTDPGTWLATRLIGGVVQPAVRGVFEEIMKTIAEWCREQSTGEFAELWPN